MKALYFLLSSSQGLPISKCCSPSVKPEPNWQNIARLIAFVFSIFPKQEEIQFSDGQRTFFTQPQAMKNGSYFFVTVFTGGGPLINLSSLSRYIGFVSSVLFQSELEECFEYLEEQMTSAIQSSTYLDTIQSASMNGDGDFESTCASLYDIYPNLIECLGVFEEHFIRELLMSDKDFYHWWFQSVSDYFKKSALTAQNSVTELYAVYSLSKNDILSPLLSVHLNQNGQNEFYIEDLMLALVEYGRSASSLSADVAVAGQLVVDSTDGQDYRQQYSNLLNVLSSQSSSLVESNDNGDCPAGSFFAVSQISQDEHLLLLVCHIPKDIISECSLHPTISDGDRSSHHEESWENLDNVSLFPIDVLPPDLCEALETSHDRLQKAFFQSLFEADEMADTLFYKGIIYARINTDPEAIYENNENQIQNENRSTKETITGEDSTRGPHLDDVEYFPQPPEKRNNAESVTSIVEENKPEKPVNKRSISRPGRTYA